jgi:hypothetical protein
VPYKLEDLVIHPEIFNGNYNKIIGSYILQEAVKKDDTIYNAVSSEAFHVNILYTKVEEKPGLKILCESLGIDIQHIFDEIDEYLSNPKSNTLEKSINLGQKLENTMFRLLFENVEYRESILKAIVKNLNYQFIKSCINFQEDDETSYSNIKRGKLKKFIPSINSNLLLTTMYEASAKKKWKMVLPKWFTESYAPLNNFIKQKEVGSELSTAELKESITKDTNALYKSLDQAIDIGYLERKTRGLYVVLRKPSSFFGINETVGKIVGKIRISLMGFQDGYCKLLRDGFFDFEKPVGNFLKRYLEEDINVDLSLFNNNQDVFEAFVKIFKMYQDITSVILQPAFSYNTTPIKEKLSNEFVKDLGDVLIQIQSEPKKGIEKIEKRYKEYSEMIKLY